ncbi:MAG: alpha/beta fold hydrolase [Deltaproteobacteria bacterium]|nr:alpha/beta fold hydrolase [Deltaproteobacteria bacterium]
MTKRYLILFMLHFALLLFGCEDDNKAGNKAGNDGKDTNVDSDSGTGTDSMGPEFNAAHLQNVELLRTLSTTDIQGTFTLFKLVAPEVAQVVPQQPTSVSIYRMTYQTLYQNSMVSASALVAIPENTTPVPVLAFQNGTNTVDADAPTVLAAAPLDVNNSSSMFMQILSASASMGYVIVVADYLGFGASAQLPHPYLCREITISSLADTLRAVVELEDGVNAAEAGAASVSSFALSGDLYLLGYSQGAHSTMALHEYLERTPDFPLVLRATAAGAGPYDLMAINQYMLAQANYPMPYLGPYTVLGFQSMGFIANDLSLFFTTPYAGLIPGLFDGIKDKDEINASLTTSMGQLFTASVQTAISGDASTDPTAAALQATLIANSIPPFVATTPIRLTHGTTDEYIPPSMTQAFQQALIAAGTPAASVTVVDIPDKDHEQAAPGAVVDAMIWFETIKNGTVQ